MAEELAQDTFLSIVQNRDALDQRRSIRAYLFAVARNKLFDLLRKRGRAPRPVDLSECSLEDLGPTPTGVFAQQRQAQLLLQALRGLPVELQVLLELRYFEGLRGPELAETLEVPEGTVRESPTSSASTAARAARASGRVPRAGGEHDVRSRDWAVVVRDRHGEP